MYIFNYIALMSFAFTGVYFTLQGIMLFVTALVSKRPITLTFNVLAAAIGWAGTITMITYICKG